MASAAAMASRNLIFSKKLVGANDASKSIPRIWVDPLAVVLVYSSYLFASSWSFTLKAG